MEYLLGGCTGLLKEVETRNKTLLRLSQIDDQSLDKNVTCLCWSGGFGGYFEDEFTVGYKDGTLRSYNYLTLKVNREYKLDSKCIYLTMLNYHFDFYSKEIYKKNTNSNLYPNTKRPSVYETNDRLLLAVSEGGYIYIFDWSVEKCDKVSTVKYLYKTKEAKKQHSNNNTNHENKNNKENKDKELNNKKEEKKEKDNKKDTNNKREENKNKILDGNDKEDELKEYIGALFVYKYKAPLSDAKVHSLMKNRLVLAGPNNPPVLFDLFSESILWTGKFPHDTVLGLQSKLEISSLCFLEEIDDDIICVATVDSFVYVYDLNAQKDPVFEFNICDYRTIGLSKRLLSLPHEDFNTRHRRTLARAINEKYSQNNRKILRLTTKPSYKLHFPKSNENLKYNNTNTDNKEKENNENKNKNSNKELNNKKEEKKDNIKKENNEDKEEDEDLYKVNDDVYIKHYNSVKNDYCNLYISDNFGTIYNLQFLTGDRLLQWIYRKVQPLVDQKLTVQSAGSAVTSDGRAKRPLDQDTKNMDLEHIKNLSNKDKYKIVEHLLEARKRLCSSSNNDKKIHFRRNHHSQFVCRILACYNFHTGSAVDLKCLCDYLVTAGLDRFTNVINTKTGKLVFRQYCNQKQTCILVKNQYLFETFQDNLEFKFSENKQNKADKENNKKEKNENETLDGDEQDDESDDNDELSRSDQDENDELGDLSDEFDLDTDQDEEDVVDSDQDDESDTDELEDDESDND